MNILVISEELTSGSGFCDGPIVVRLCLSFCYYCVSVGFT